VVSCTAEALNGTDLKGKTALCFPLSDNQKALVPVQQFQNATQNVLDAGGSGLVFAQYTTNLLDVTENCGGIPCVLVDIDTGYKILRYIRTARYNYATS